MCSLGILGCSPVLNVFHFQAAKMVSTTTSAAPTTTSTSTTTTGTMGPWGHEAIFGHDFRGLNWKMTHRLEPWINNLVWYPDFAVVPSTWTELLAEDLTAWPNAISQQRLSRQKHIYHPRTDPRIDPRTDPWISVVEMWVLGSPGSPGSPR